MDCPFSQNRPMMGSCSSCCAFRRVSAKDTECLLAKALEVYISNNERVCEPVENGKAN